jgi:hypothetical protein
VRAADAIDLLARGEVWWSKFAHAAKLLPPAQLRRLLARLQREVAKNKGVLACAVHYLGAMVDDSSDDALVKSWRAALVGLDGVQMYAFDLTKKHNKLKRLASDARLVAAWQEAAVASERLAFDVLALLVIDASDASLDALLPHLERARGDHERLEQLEALQRYQTPATAALFAQVRDTLHRRRAGSAVLALGERFGLASQGRFQLKLVIRAKQRVQGSTFDEVSLTFDSHEAPGYFLTFGQASNTSSSHREVKTSLEKLPKALTKLARAAKAEWNFAQATARPHGRAKVTKLLAWLAGSTETR